MTALAIIQSLYADFVRGDLPALLQKLDPDIEWTANVDYTLAPARTVPCYAPGRGVAFVAEYFQKLGSNYEMRAFDLVSFMSNAREVAVRIRIDFTIRPTGRRITGEVVHHWTVDDAGRVTRFVDFEDTLGFAHAWRPVA